MKADTEQQDNSGDKLRVHVALLGARMNYAIPRIMYRAGMLVTHYTDFYIGNKKKLSKTLRVLHQLFPSQSLKRALGRSHQELHEAPIVSHEFLGLLYWFLMKRSSDSHNLLQVVARRARAFNKAIIARNTISRGDIVFGFNGASKELFEYAKSKGAVCVLEQTIAPREVENQLLTLEIEKWPDWEPSLVLPSKTDIRSQREAEEWALADMIIGASTFVLDGLIQCGVSADKCVEVPYGVSIPKLVSPEVPTKKSHSKLRVLFAGEVGLRKGIPYLLSALRLVGEEHIEARCVGKISISKEKLRPYQDLVTFVGVVPRDEMEREYEWADVLCIASICEGSATVSYEALARGVPVIATPNAGTRVVPDVTGQLVPAGNVKMLAAAFIKYVEDRDCLRSHSIAASENIDQVSIETYEANVLNAVRHVSQARSNS